MSGLSDQRNIGGWEIRTLGFRDEEEDVNNGSDQTAKEDQQDQRTDVIRDEWGEADC